MLMIPSSVVILSYSEYDDIYNILYYFLPLVLNPPVSGAMRLREPSHEFS